MKIFGGTLSWKNSDETVKSPDGIEATKASGMDLVTRIPPASSRLNSWFGIITEACSGAWQRNMELRIETSMSHVIAWTCVTLIASDIAKLRIRLMQEDENEVMTEVESAAFSPVLRKPNHYQNRIQFLTCWLLSKLTHGNAYMLKRRDGRGVVVALYVLDPTRVQVLVAPNGEVFYQLSTDALSLLNGDSSVTVPASEIIHDIHIPLYHPLVGVSAFYALGSVVAQGLQIISNSSRVFANGSQVSGVLTAPKEISEATAKRIQQHWEENFTGERNIGKVAVLGDGLTFEKMSLTAVDMQLIDQLKWGDEKICGALHVPAYMAGVGPSPTYQNAETMNQQYYSQCLQSLIEQVELCLSEGLSLPSGVYVELDVENGLLRMDSAAKMEKVVKAVGAAVYTPNEGRREFNKKPVEGGDTPYLQEQNWPLRLLSARELPTRPPTDPASMEPPMDAAAKAFMEMLKSDTSIVNPSRVVMDAFTEGLAA